MGCVSSKGTADNVAENHAEKVIIESSRKTHDFSMKKHNVVPEEKLISQNTSGRAENVSSGRIVGDFTETSVKEMKSYPQISQIRDNTTTSCIYALDLNIVPLVDERKYSKVTMVPRITSPVDGVNFHFDYTQNVYVSSMSSLQETVDQSAEKQTTDINISHVNIRLDCPIFENEVPLAVDCDPANIAVCHFKYVGNDDIDIVYDNSKKKINIVISKGFPNGTESYADIHSPWGNNVGGPRSKNGGILICCDS